MQVISTLSLKGGVGKTTLTLNLGAALKLLGQKVLIVDLDPNNDLTMNLGYDSSQLKGVEYFLTGDMKFQDIKIPIENNFDLLPAGKRLKDLEISLSRLYTKNPEFSLLLKQSIENLSVKYDIIMVDCPAHSGLLNYNALSLSSWVIIPIQCQPMGLRGSKRAVFFTYRIQTKFNPHLKILGIVPTMYDGRSKLSAKIHQSLKHAYGELTTDSIIRVNVSLAEAAAEGKTIFQYKPHSRGSSDFKSLGREIYIRLKRAESQPSAVPAD